MRTALLILSTVALVAACANDGTTSPATRNASSSARASLSPDTPPGPSAGAGAKPNSGFTTMTSVAGAIVTYNPISTSGGVAIATCPAGSYVTGGGYEFTNGALDASVVYNGPLGTNSWRVFVDIGTLTSFRAFALCVQ